MAKMKIKKGDKVRVIAGKDKGAEGEVIKSIPAKGRVIVENVNMVTKALHPSQQNQTGGLTKKAAPLEISNVQLICPSCNKPTRVGHKVEDGKKFRACKKCGAIIR
jgi:large subunit ribosomal protein L24